VRDVPAHSIHVQFGEHEQGVGSIAGIHDDFPAVDGPVRCVRMWRGSGGLKVGKPTGQWIAWNRRMTLQITSLCLLGDRRFRVDGSRMGIWCS